MRQPSRSVRHRHGAVAVLIAVLLPLALLFAAYVIGVAQMHLTRAELSAAVDSAARAGARELSRTQSIDDARKAAIEAASRNLVAGKPLKLETPDIQFGVNTQATAKDIAGGNSSWVFTPDQGKKGPINAVRVTGSKAKGSPSGHVQLWFTPFLTTKTFEPVKTAGAMQIDRDVVLVVDRSRSMASYVNDEATVSAFNAAVSEAMSPVAAAYVAGEISVQDYIDAYGATLDALEGPFAMRTKWDALSDAVDAFLDELARTVAEEKVGLVWFDDTAGTAQELTFNYPSISAAMDELEPRGGTGIGNGLQRGVDVLNDPSSARPFAQKVAVVMTDGLHNVGTPPEVVAETVVVDSHLVIHGITFGTSVDTARMQLTSEIGDGRYWHANEAKELERVYREIAADQPTVLTN